MLRRIGITALSAGLLIVGRESVLATQNAAQATTVDVQKLGPQVGTRVPDFLLTDSTGQTHTLASAMGAKGAMLVFFRSADW